LNTFSTEMAEVISEEKEDYPYFGSVGFDTGTLQKILLVSPTH